MVVLTKPFVQSSIRITMSCLYLLLTEIILSVLVCSSSSDLPRETYTDYFQELSDDLFPNTIRNNRPIENAVTQRSTISLVNSTQQLSNTTASIPTSTMSLNSSSTATSNSTQANPTPASSTSGNTSLSANSTSPPTTSPAVSTTTQRTPPSTTSNPSTVNTTLQVTTQIPHQSTISSTTVSSVMSNSTQGPTSPPTTTKVTWPAMWTSITTSSNNISTTTTVPTINVTLANATAIPTIIPPVTMPPTTPNTSTPTRPATTARPSTTASLSTSTTTSRPVPTSRPTQTLTTSPPSVQQNVTRNCTLGEDILHRIFNRTSSDFGGYGLDNSVGVVGNIEEILDSITNQTRNYTREEILACLIQYRLPDERPIGNPDTSAHSQLAYARPSHLGSVPAVQVPKPPSSNFVYGHGYTTYIDPFNIAKKVPSFQPSRYVMANSIQDIFVTAYRDFLREWNTIFQYGQPAYWFRP